VNAFKTLSEDDSPMVRRACAQALAHFSEHTATYKRVSDKVDFDEILGKLSSDD